MIRSTLARRLVRSSAALLTVAGLLAGIGVQHAAADSPTAPAPVYRPLRTPVLLSVEATSSTSITARWQDTSSGETGYHVVAGVGGTGNGREMRGEFVLAVPGQGGIGTAIKRDLEPSTYYCVRVIPHVRGLLIRPDGAFPYQSNELCTTTPAAPVLSVPAQPFIVPIGR